MANLPQATMQTTIDNLRRALKEAAAEMDRRYEMGVTAERERVVALSREVQATYWVGPDDHPAPRRPFFFLIRESAGKR